MIARNPHDKIFYFTFQCGIILPVQITSFNPPNKSSWPKDEPSTLRNVALVLPPRGNYWQGHPWLVLASFAHHPVVALLPDHAMRCSGRGGGRGSDDHVCVMWLVGSGVVGVGTLWTEEVQLETCSPGELILGKLINLDIKKCTQVLYFLWIFRIPITETSIHWFYASAAKQAFLQLNVWFSKECWVDCQCKIGRIQQLNKAKKVQLSDKPSYLFHEIVRWDVPPAERIGSPLVAPWHPLLVIIQHGSLLRGGLRERERERHY